MYQPVLNSDGERVTGLQTASDVGRGEWDDEVAFWFVSELDGSLLCSLEPASPLSWESVYPVTEIM